MKVTWEVKDVTVGRRYSKIGISEVWMIGYRADLDGEARFAAISLSDGMVTGPYTKEAFAKELSRLDYLPAELLP